MPRADEAYVEVGVYHGASLIAALLGNEDARVIGIDSFGFRDGSLEKVEQNLERFGVSRPEILVGDAFELVPSGALDGTPVGVWYYDAAHDYDSQVEGLRIAEPLLAPGALMIVDDTDWEQVARAMDDYLAPAACAPDPHDRGQGARLSPVVGGNTGPRLAGIEGNTTAAAAKRTLRIARPESAGADSWSCALDPVKRQLAAEIDAVPVVQRERRSVRHPFDHRLPEAQARVDRAVSPERDVCWSTAISRPARKMRHVIPIDSPVVSPTQYRLV